MRADSEEPDGGNREERVVVSVEDGHLFSCRVRERTMRVKLSVLCAAVSASWVGFGVCVLCVRERHEAASCTCGEVASFRRLPSATAHGTSSD